MMHHLNIKKEEKIEFLKNVFENSLLKEKE